MVSAFGKDGFPKYVWAVDEDGEVYEAKTDGSGFYHGYRLGTNDRMHRDYILKEWNHRCPTRRETCR